MESTPMAIATPNWMKSCRIHLASPVRTWWTPSGRFRMDGVASIRFRVSPSGRPLRLAVILIFRLRSSRVICAGPEPSLISATFISGTGPLRPGTDNRRIRSISPRVESLSRTRMGIWRLSRLNLASPVSTSPLVAIRVTSPSTSVVTPSSAARSGSGRTTISGLTRAALLVTVPSPGMVRITRSTAAPASARRTESSPVRVISRPPPPMLEKDRRAPGTSRSSSVARRS